MNFTKQLLLMTTLLAACAIGCGGGGAGDSVGDSHSANAFVVEGQPLSARHLSIYERVSACTGLTTDVPPYEQYFPVKPCPTSHRLCCMDDPRFPDFDCGDGTGDICGYAGSYNGAGTIELPAGTPCGDAADHEIWRYLLQYNGDPRWDSFDLPNLPATCPQGIS